jgi:hypothetical protein
MCPALIFAANRKDRVRGRTRTLVVSIKTRNGFSQSGAPSGRKCAVDFLGLWANLEIISLSHAGKPIVRVKIKCLEDLKIYGTSPSKLTIITIINKVEIIVDRPFKLIEVVRFSWVNIVVVKGDFTAVDRFIDIQSGVCIIKIITMFKSRNMEFDGKSDLNTYGSKDEKISGIMQDLDYLSI